MTAFPSQSFIGLGRQSKDALAEVIFLVVRRRLKQVKDAYLVRESFRASTSILTKGTNDSAHRGHLYQVAI